MLCPLTALIKCILPNPVYNAFRGLVQLSKGNPIDLLNKGYQNIIKRRNVRVCGSVDWWHSDWPLWLIGHRWIWIDRTTGPGKMIKSPEQYFIHHPLLKRCIWVWDKSNQQTKIHCVVSQQLTEVYYFYSSTRNSFHSKWQPSIWTQQQRENEQPIIQFNKSFQPELETGKKQ